MGVDLRTPMRAVVLGCALGSLLLVAPATAGASTKGFDVTNHSSYQLRLASIHPYKGICRERECLETRPPIGDMLQPGASERFELYAPYSERTGAFITYSVYDGQTKVGTDEISLLYEYHAGGGGMASQCVAEGSFKGTTCTADGYTTYSNSVKFYDPPGSERTISTKHPGSQARVLTGLCGENPVENAICDFTSLEGPEDGFLPGAVIGSAVANCQSTDKDSEIEFKDERSNTNSIEITIGAKYEDDFWLGKAEVSLEAAYGHEWEHSTTFYQKVPFSVDAGHLAWVTDTVPVITYLGDYSIKLNGATINVTDVAFHRPDDSRSAIWVTHEAEMTAAQKKTLCTGSPDTPLAGSARGGLRMVPASEVRKALKHKKPKHAKKHKKSKKHKTHKSH
jgi:hypothetical protein